MADTYLDSSMVGFDHQDYLDLKVDTYKRLAPIMNMQDAPAIGADFANNLKDHIVPLEQGYSQKIPELTSISLGDALISKDPNIKAFAQQAMKNGANQNAEAKFNLGRSIESNYNESVEKFYNKEFGYSALRDNEDFYYRNDYMADGAVWRTTKNVGKFIGRVAVPAVLKIGEGLGYVGSMLTSIGSDNYWADVADNGLSTWLEGLEQDYKDHILPVYKQAGFDDKGFFSKLGDWSFWNESVADGVAFMASAAVPGMGFGKLGQLGKFGQAFSTATKAGKLASKVGMGSWAELSSWAFNTGMESATEGAGVFKTVKADLEEKRRQGVEGFSDLSDEDIREMAGNHAATTTVQNFAALAFSNAFENTLFFKPFKDGKAKISLKNDFSAESQALQTLEKENFWKNITNPLSGTGFYGANALKAAGMEGLWEENAQLAIQRINESETDTGFFEQLVDQTIAAFSGNDKEASESIGLGALIGIGAGGVLSKASGERRKHIEATRNAIANIEVARQNLFNNNDIWKTDKDGVIEYVNKQPQVDPVKLKTKQDELAKTYKDIALGTKNDYFNSKPVEFKSKMAFANFVRSLHNSGIENISSRFDNMSEENARLFGFDPESINKYAKDFKQLATKFETASGYVNDLTIGVKPKGVEDAEYKVKNAVRKAKVYNATAQNELLATFTGELNAQLADSVAKFRGITNGNINDTPVDHINTLIIKQKKNKEIMDNPGFAGSPLISQEYHKQRDAELQRQIEDYKTNYDVAFKDVAVTAGGFYVTTTEVGGVRVPDKISLEAGKIQSTIAAYENTINKNAYIGQLLSGDNWYDNMKKLNETPLNTKADTAIATATAASTGTPAAVAAVTSKFREKKKGDFANVLTLVNKMLYVPNATFSKEENELSDTYKDLVNKLIEEYGTVAEEQRVNFFRAKIAANQKVMASITAFLHKGAKGMEEAKTELNILLEELRNFSNNGRANQDRIGKTIKSLNDKINAGQKSLDRESANYTLLVEHIRNIEQEITDNNYEGLVATLNDLKEQRDWNAALLDEQKTILQKMSDLLKSLVRAAGRIFGKGWQERLKTAFANNIDFVKEIPDTKDKIAAANTEIAKLEDTQKFLDERYNAVKANNDAIVAQVNKVFEERYLDLTKEVVTKATAPEEKTITDALTSDNNAFPNAFHSEGDEYVGDDGFDGDSYMRPLHSKFFTTTFPSINYGNNPSGIPFASVSQDVKDHISFIDYVTDPANVDDVKKKIGKGVLKVLVVNKNNVNALKMKQLYDEKKSIDGGRYGFDQENPNTTHFEAVHVIEKEGKLFYIDKNLNVGKEVGTELKADEWNKVVRRSFKLPELSAKDRDTYLKMTDSRGVAKYDEKDIDKAEKAAKDWRTEVLASKTNLTYKFSVTRGVANKMTMQDGLQAKNPVQGILLPDGKIDPQAVKIFNNAGLPIVDVPLNNEVIQVPSGRPFIYTTNGIDEKTGAKMEQLHAADNNKLDDAIINTVVASFNKLLQDHVAKVMDAIEKVEIDAAIKNKIKSTGLTSLTEGEKTALYLKLAKAKVAQFDPVITNYLGSVVYFSKLTKKDGAGNLVPHPKQIYIKGSKLMFGNKVVADITEGKINDAEVAGFLKGQFHNVRYFTSAQKAGGKFTEFYLEGTELKTRPWPNYATYLLAAKYPDGKDRAYLPITTSIKSKAQNDAEKNAPPYQKYQSRAITIETTHIENAKPSVKEVPKANMKADTTGKTKMQIARDLAAARAAGTTVETKAAEKKEEKKEEKKKEKKPSVAPEVAAKAGETKMAIARRLAREKEEAKNKPKVGVTPQSAKQPDDDVPDYSDDDLMDDGFDDSHLDEDEMAKVVARPRKTADDILELNLRVAFPELEGGGMFVTEDDLDGVVAEIARMIPQFPVNRLKHMIQTTDGVEAWGQFKNDMIFLYEAAEKGTGYHEAFEAVVNKLLTDKEWGAMFREFKGRSGYFTDRESGERMKYADASEYQAKEQLAEEFMDMKLGKKQPVQPQAKSFLQIMWNLIKQFFGIRNTIDDVFSKIDQGKFATREVRAEDRFTNNYRRKLLGVKPQVKRDLMHEGLYYMTNYIFATPESLANFDLIKETDESIYEVVKKGFMDRINTMNQAIQAIEDITDKSKDDKDKQLKLAVSIKYKEYILNNWKEFVEAHKEFLKPYQIEFKEGSGELTEEEKDNKNRNDYTKDVFTIPVKNSASPSVRLLFRALLDVSKNPKGTVLTLKDGTIVPDPKVNLSSTFGPKLSDYDQYMLKALNEFTGLGDFSKIKDKLEEMSGIKEMKDMSAAEQTLFVKSMTNEQAVWTNLYRRLFDVPDAVTEESVWQMKVKFHNYISKQSPEPFLFVLGGDTSSFISSNKREVYENIIGKMQSAFLQQNSAIFTYEKGKEGEAGSYVSKYKTAISFTEFMANKGEKLNALVKFLGIQDEYNQYVEKYRTNTAELNRFNLQFLTIRNSLVNARVQGFSVSELGIFGYADKLIKKLDNELGLTEKGTQFLNFENKSQSNHITPSFASRVISAINNAATRKEVEDQFPQLATYFASDSIMMKRLFDEKGNRILTENISLGYVEAIKELADNEGKKVSKLEQHDRHLLQFNATLSGLYYTLPADSETEWVFNMGEFVEYTGGINSFDRENIIKEMFLPKLRAEIAQAKAYNGGFLQMDDVHKGETLEINGKKITIGKSLRFFKDILASNPKLRDKIQAEIYGGKKDITIVSENRAAIITAIGKYLDGEILKSSDKLQEYRIANTVDGKSFRMTGINNYFINKYSKFFNADETNVSEMGKEQFMEFVAYQKVNSILGHMEQFKLLYGDPAQYKDFEKRAKSMLSPVEQSYIDSTGEFDTWLNANKNTATIVNEGGVTESVQIPEGDLFHKTFADEIQTRTIDDLQVVDVNAVNILRGKASKFADKFVDAYEKNEEADGQSIGTLGFAREMMIKAGWRWTQKMEDFYQLDTAMMRSELSKTGKYKYTSAALQKMDEKIIAKYPDGLEEPITPLKTLMPAVDKDGNQTLLKHSIFFMSYQTAKQFQMLDDYLDMLKRKDDVLNFKSAQKIGLRTDTNGKITPYYAMSANGDFVRNDIVAAGNPDFKLSYRTIGIQVETQSTEWGQTLGSQLSKDINLNLMPNGLPADFKLTDADGKAMGKSETREVWDALTEAEKLEKSEFYRMIKGENGTITTLENLKVRNTLDAFTRLGIKWSYEGDNISFSFDNLSKAEKYIKDEIQRLEIDENALENLGLTEDLKAFLNPAETLPSYDRISNLLWALADKSTTSMSVNGKPLVQVSSTFFNKGSRKSAYKDKDGKWVTVDSKEQYDKAVAEGKKMVMTSTELKFYDVDPNTGETLGMEILIPNYYKKKVNDARKAKGLPKLSDQQLLDYLNSDKRLLEGVGFRIPTQATSSLEFFTIKGFLPKSFGSAVVVPSAITTKAGSDFDVDKLNTYLYNYKLDKNGMPYYEEFKDDTNSTPESRYSAYIHAKFNDLLQPIKEKLEQSQYLLKANDFTVKRIEQELNKFEEINLDNSPEGNLISALFQNSINNIQDAIRAEEKQSALQSQSNLLLLELENVEKEYKSALKQIETQISLEQFKKLPLFMQNTKGALENKYFQSIRTVLKHPSMFEYLLSPNSLEHIVSMRDTVYDALGQTPDNKKALNYTNFLSDEYISEKRQQFVKGKTDIGIFAVSMTNFANSQVAGIGVTEGGGIKATDVLTMSLNEGELGLPFEDIKTTVINGREFISISELSDANGSLTMDKLSSYVNGAVDVAKDPVIVQMGMHTEIAGVYVLLERMGLTGETIAVFMYQPVVREYLKELLFMQNKSFFGYSNYESKTKMIKEMADYYGKDKGYDKDFKFDNDTLRKMIKRGTEVGKENYSPAEKHLQYMVLATFLKTQMYAQHLLESVTSSNHDTASIRNSYTVAFKDIKLEKSRGKNMIGKPVMKDGKSSVQNGGEALREETFVKTDVKLLKTFNKLFASFKLFALQRENPQAALNAVADRLVTENPYMGADDFVYMMKTFEAATLDSLIATVPVGDSLTPLHKMDKTLFWTKSDKSLKVMFEDLKKKYPKYFRDNYFLSNLTFDTDPATQLDTMRLQLNLSPSDTVSREGVTEALRSLASESFAKDFPDLSKFYKSVVYGAFRQFGIKYVRGSFVDLIPSESLIEVMNAALQTMDNEDLSAIRENAIRAKWYNKKLIESRAQMAVHFLESNDKGEMKLAKKESWRSGKSKPAKKTSQTFFSKWKKGEGFVWDVKPAMFWGGYLELGAREFEQMEDFKAVPAVRPEYIETFMNSNGFSEKRLSKKARDMAKAGNHSYLTTILYKKVGVEDKSLGRKYKTDKSMYYLYKPVHKYGTRNFNGIIPVEVANGTTLGSKSFVEDINFVEMDDNEIIINTTDSRLESVVDEVVKAVDIVAPLTPKKVIGMDTRSKTGNNAPVTTQAVSYKWARSANNNYEVSTKGDKRFSALVAVVKKGTPLDLPGKEDYVLERDTTIEELYQVGVKGYKTVNAGKGKAPLRKMTKEETWAYYKAFWKAFAEQNPTLMDDLAAKAKGKTITDKFANTEVSQAKALAEILNEKHPSTDVIVTPNDVPPIQPKCDK